MSTEMGLFWRTMENWLSYNNDMLNDHWGGSFKKVLLLMG